MNARSRNIQDEYSTGIRMGVVLAGPQSERSSHSFRPTLVGQFAAAFPDLWTGRRSMTLIRCRWLASAGLVAVVAISGCVNVEAQRVEGSFERTLTVGQQPHVDVVSGSGSIEIRQGGSGRVEIRGRIRAGDWGWSRSRLRAEDHVKRLEANPPIEQQGNTVR